MRDHPYCAGQGRARRSGEDPPAGKINVFVASAPDFTELHLVATRSGPYGPSAGERGKHARAAIGMAALPLNAAVEIDAVIEVE